MPSPTLRCIGVSREMVSTTLAGLSPVPRRLRPQSHVGVRGRPPSSRSSLLDFLLHRTKPRISTTHGVSSSPLVNSASPCRERTVRLTAKQSITGAARPSAVYNFLVRQTEVHPSGSLKASRTTVTEVMALLKRSMSALPFSPDLRECGQAVRRAEDVAPSAFLVARRTMPIRTIRLFPYGASLFHVRPGALSGKGHAGSVPSLSATQWVRRCRRTPRRPPPIDCRPRSWTANALRDSSSTRQGADGHRGNGRQRDVYRLRSYSVASTTTLDLYQSNPPNEVTPPLAQDTILRHQVPPSSQFGVGCPLCTLGADGGVSGKADHDRQALRGEEGPGNTGRSGAK
jgi:hypothetical protein